MKDSVLITDSFRLAKLLQSPEGVSYCVDAPLSGQKERRISIHANYLSGETFVVVTDGSAIGVRSFFSRHKSCPPEVRRKGIPLVDMADAFELARRMCRNLAHSGPRARTAHRRTARANP